jgi:hypothetical protein
MAKKTKSSLVKPKLPEGAREVRAAQFLGDFWNPEPGDEMTAFMVGTKPIKRQSGELVDRYVVLDQDGGVWILPDHADLVAKLAGIPMGNRVYLAYLGKETVKTRRWPKGRPIARWLVGDFGSPDPGAKALVARYAAELRSAVFPPEGGEEA